MKTGISIYLSSGIGLNKEVIRKAKAAGASYGFTSLHIPEEDYDDYKKRVEELLKLTHDAGIELITDVEGDTPSKLGLDKMEDLLNYGVTSIRLDYGFTDEDVVRLSRNFNIVWNASTVNPFDIRKWEKLGADIDRFTACHNYYPKPYTGLDLNDVRDTNKTLKSFGYTVSAFVPGDRTFRGPLNQGLPTIEDHRNTKKDLVANMMDLYSAYTDIVMVGDVDISDDNWNRLSDLSDGFIRLHATFEKSAFAQKICGNLNHERPDSSPYIIRSQETRICFKDFYIPAYNTIECGPGAICISNDDYPRYKGEVEICRVARPADPKLNVIGQIVPDDLKYLPYIKNGMGFVIEEV